MPSSVGSKKPRKAASKTSKKTRSKATLEDVDQSTLDVGASESRNTFGEGGLNGDEEGATEYQMAMEGDELQRHSENKEHENIVTGGAEEAEDDEFQRSSIEGPAPTPLLEDGFNGVSQPNDLEVALKMALERLENMPIVDFLQNISKQADVHAQAVSSAKEIANDFVANAADLAEAMQMILQYDQLMLKKLNLTSPYDFGVKPKTVEETRAVMIDRAQKMLDLGQMQYDMSHQISKTARPLVDFRFEACDNFNAVQEKISSIRVSEEARKEAHLTKVAKEEVEAEAADEAAPTAGAEGTEGSAKATNPTEGNDPSKDGSKNEANPTSGN
ncbi:hypothetical protein ECG_07438 [Echinococcus granulosus]|uniref:DUF5740 domain-containing protein n=1 Tax=Echinococcus granulosus TaxID=6210 RepID=U6JDL4_ECHGR|nr:hypothetical protein EGR_05118 [Echinococcus granulosus]EUB59957.1 hypothetical protein EGR_05118 [Echinococcus granulosus]KAH9280901.1 hypothetical protein ECG_07438 [Echinococcus granulosus]CDS22140.1 hypothetical protein EgrG_000054600 [Echinococcus granulosus]